jgi:plastocyanin
MHSTSFALRRGALIGLLLVASLVLAACGGGEETTSAAPSDDTAASAAPSDDNSAGGTVSVVDGAVDVSAADLAFDANLIQATAGEAFTVTFTNNEGIPHNFSVYTEEGGDAIVQGDVINEGETDEVEVPALEPGEYYFVCDLHPEMNGVIVVEG